MNTKYKEIRLLLKEVDYKRISELAETKGLTRAGYLRSLVNLEIDDERQPNTKSKDLIQLIYQFRKIGLNINQIAKKLNTHHDISHHFFLQQLLTLHKELKEVVNDRQN